MSDFTYEMRIFDFDDYKKFVLARVASMPRRGHGQFRQIAKHLDIHTTMVTQIFRGSKDLTMDQGFRLSDYFGLTELETEYLLTLIQYERAGHFEYKQRIKKKIETLKTEAQEVGKRIPVGTILSQADKAVFYSSWFYSGIRLLTSVKGFRTIDALSEHFQLPRATVAKTVEFLLKTGLCRMENGELQMQVSATHISAEDPLINHHHTNWRLKAMERFGRLQKEELLFTSPLTISVKDSARVREILLRAIEDIMKIVDDSGAEKLSCLNIDWFDVS